VLHAFDFQYHHLFTNGRQEFKCGVFVLLNGRHFSDLFFKSHVTAKASCKNHRTVYGSYSEGPGFKSLPRD
jgi:hypothetical protein